MPEMDGVEVTRRLKSMKPSAEILIIMLTSQSEKTVVMDSRRAGASDFIVKPFDKNILMRRLHRLLEDASGRPSPPAHEPHSE